MYLKSKTNRLRDRLEVKSSRDKWTVWDNKPVSYDQRNVSRMNILLLAPHPFYQNRGTPIAVNLVLKVLSERGDKVDVVTYPEGRDINYENIKIYRTPKLPWVRNIRPGFSWKKIVCDVFMLLAVIRLVTKKRYDLVHAGEESVFIGLGLKILCKIPYIYDMDSSIAQQMIEKYPLLHIFSSVFNFFEGLAVKNAKVVVSVCDALAADIQKYKPRKTVVIPDISLLNSNF
ncbi:MAG: glycosyltransferase [Moorea sp. SIO3I7]|nr:glycosyltransferase [Moorena sp. SIO3I7]NEO04802.1 glycosyltransferase [Moorena sp. SIO3I8]NEO18592.1 glycosyltransferase [Moorena sp. SIO4A5]NEP23234.1 glycosyltransferase [Moorena sp. SIO3I6]NEQ56450.1 glycosyltransferase [Moorena sp. SIO4A1]